MKPLPLPFFLFGVKLLPPIPPLSRYKADGTADITELRDAVVYLRYASRLVKGTCRTLGQQIPDIRLHDLRRGVETRLLGTYTNPGRPLVVMAGSQS